MINNNCQPPSASGSPRFCNMGNFMRLPHVTSAEGLDFAIVGIPFDTAASFRAGARFGPNGVRNISAMIKPNNVAMGVNIMDSLKGADLGDVPVIPDYIHETYAAIEQTLDGVLECGAVPISIGGDHAITLGELRAIAKKHGKVSLVHFDSHLDLCDTVFGQKYNHGTPFRRAMEEGLIDPEKSVQIGMRGSLFLYFNDLGSNIMIFTLLQKIICDLKRYCIKNIKRCHISDKTINILINKIFSLYCFAMLTYIHRIAAS